MSFGSRMQRICLGLTASLVLMACTERSNCEGSAGARDCAAELIAPLEVASQSQSDGAPSNPVAAYFDRSGSMAGFLDSAFLQDSTGYREVIDKVLAHFAPDRVYSFGNSVRVATASLGVLGEKPFYSEGNTRLEQAVDSVLADEDATRSHLIVGDGRRTSPSAANGQFTALRQAALEWEDRGGTFMVGATLARFQPVQGDPSGCYSAATAPPDARCPLYVFAFVAPGDEMAIGRTIARVFEHVFAWPAPAVTTSVVTLRASEAVPTGVTYEHRWMSAPAGSPVARLQSTVAAANQVKLQIALEAEDDVRRFHRKMIASQAGDFRAFAAPLASADQPRWNRSNVWTQRGVDTIQATVYGPGGGRFANRLELSPMGRPRWLSQFAAEGAGDAVRTFGLPILFEAFVAGAAAQAREPLVRAFVLTE